MISKRFPTDPYQQLAALARAFTSAARLQILHVLSADEACVCHLTTILGRRQANVSQHLMVLRDARLVEDRRDGMMVYYRLADSRAPEIVALLRDLMPEGTDDGQMPDVSLAPIQGCPCPRCNDGGNGPS